MSFQTLHLNHLKLFLYFAGLFVLHGCSNEQLYNIFQDREKSLCETGPPAEYEQCRKAATEEPYKEYERKREEDKN